MNDSKDLSLMIMEALKPILPKGLGFIIVYGSAESGEMGVAGNLPDETSIMFLETAASIVKEEPAVSLGEEALPESKPNTSLN